MPYKIRKLPNQNSYKVYNANTGKVYSKSSTLDNANKQIRLLHMIEGQGLENYYDYPKLQKDLQIAGTGFYHKF